MTPARTILNCALLAGLLGGCTTQERVWGNLYDGVQMQQRQAAPPGSQPQPPTPGYDEYLRQRQEVLQGPAPPPAPGPADK